MASKIFGAGAERILSVLLFLGVLAYVNGLLLSNPRVMYAMAKIRFCLRHLQRKTREKPLHEH